MAKRRKNSTRRQYSPSTKNVRSISLTRTLAYDYTSPNYDPYLNYQTTQSVLVNPVNRNRFTQANKQALYDRYSFKAVTPVNDLYKALICKKREERKRVLFANNKTGSGGQRQPKFKLESTVRC